VRTFDTRGLWTGLRRALVHPIFDFFSLIFFFSKSVRIRTSKTNKR
jgi:hypothetical protein